MGCKQSRAIAALLSKWWHSKAQPRAHSLIKDKTLKSILHQHWRQTVSLLGSVPLESDKRGCRSGDYKLEADYTHGSTKHTQSLLTLFTQWRLNVQGNTICSACNCWRFSLLTSESGESCSSGVKGSLAAQMPPNFLLCLAVWVQRGSRVGPLQPLWWNSAALSHVPNSPPQFYMFLWTRDFTLAPWKHAWSSKNMFYSM